ncbi:hypothetical protein [Pseudohoeflea coraliihabitans]|uniref:Uncharacterized protein n=1 Tax=Pseudohoeflea coraliihabitans TaxID=2860393 RepID=A0ABS6WKS2_9HYPH|nr:hypothetical protein [Pseudohoeflea sp. DP4N28-3]MBW3096562.1 hypothetical protein [Pseudohoeflea sp. DP4N28-3]
MSISPFFGLLRVCVRFRIRIADRRAGDETPIICPLQGQFPDDARAEDHFFDQKEKSVPKDALVGSMRSQGTHLAS